MGDYKGNYNMNKLIYVYMAIVIGLTDVDRSVN